ncbi:MAG: preprotein translocase subunit SecA [Candidatus Berkiella sp.]
MFSGITKILFGSRNQRLIKRYRKTVQAINALEASYEKLSDDALREKTNEFRARFQKGETLDQLLAEAFAVVREAGKRTLGMRHFDVQLIGGMVLHSGKIAEMSTGEGKTLVATLPVYLNTLSGKSVHVVTVNDYLARRDANWMLPLYRALGLTVGIVVPRMRQEVKRESYLCDVVYATNNELGFDYLRNKMAHSQEECLQQELNFAIVDEVDSILIDEARTPLIISGAAEDSSELYIKMNDIVPALNPQAVKDGPGDYSIDEKSKQVHLTEEGHLKVEALLVKEGLLTSGKSLYDPMNIGLLHHLNASLRAHALYKRDVDYLVLNNEVVIVDEHTGRTMPGRRWSDGLHQAVEAKERVQIQSENQTLASITFQNFFRLYNKLAGMTGTADTEAYEFQQIYNLEVVVIPTNKPCVRQDKADIIYLSKQEKFEAIVEEIKACVKANRPVLVGTISIENSELLSNILKSHKIKHQVLNAKFHEQEAQIVAEAGRPGTVTIATNMAGRGTDIVLGGSLEAQLRAFEEQPTQEQVNAIRQEWKERHDAVVSAGGLHIIGTERHESRRIDNQLRGRAGRQGDPGSSSFYLSLEDNLMRIFGSDKMAGLMRRLGVEKGEAITHPWVTRAIENAQRKVEGHNFDIRKQLLEYDNVANDQRRVMYDQRDILMVSTDISENVKGIRESVIQSVISEFIPPQSVEDMWDIDGLEQTLESEFGLNLPIKQWLEESNVHEEVIRERVLTASVKAYEEKESVIGFDAMRRFEKSVMLHSLDLHWRDHLSQMEYLRQSIFLRGYAQKDPKQEYKREAFNLFTAMLESIKRQVISLLSVVEVQAAADIDEAQAQEEQRRLANNENMIFRHASSSALESEEEQMALEHEKMSAAGGGTVSRASPKVGRNDLCPCGSGKKFKHCHGTLA